MGEKILEEIIKKKFSLISKFKSPHTKQSFSQHRDVQCKAFYQIALNSSFVIISGVLYIQAQYRKNHIKSARHKQATKVTEKLLQYYLSQPH